MSKPARRPFDRFRLPADRRAWVVALMVAFPAIYMLVTLVTYSVNTPFWDQWGFVDLLGKMNDGTLSVYDLWTQTNEHRILVPRAFSLLLAKLTGYNVRAEVIMNAVVASATLSLLITMIHRSFGKLKTASYAAMILTAWLLFSPIQWINWIWGFQLAFFMAVCFTVLTIWLLARKGTLQSDTLFRLSVLVAVMATYSLGNGMLVWVVGGYLLLVKKATRQRGIIWTTAAVVAIGSYLYKFERSDASLPLDAVIKQPVAVARYIWQYLGHNLALTPEGAKYTGIVLLVLLVSAIAYLFKQRKLDEMQGWVALAGFGFLTATFAAASRLNFGVDHSMVFSYTTISVLFVIGTLVISTYALGVWMAKPTAKQIAPTAGLFFLLGVLAFPAAQSFVKNHQLGMKNLKEERVHFEKVQKCITTATSAEDDCLLHAFPDKQVVWEKLDILKAMKWGDY